MANSYEDRPYEVGKGKPPKASQFKPGQKPPKGAGRPKGAKNKNPLRKILSELVSVPDKNGKTVMVSLEEAMHRRLVHKAVQDGNLPAISLITRLLIEMEKLRISEAPSEEEIRRQREEEAEKRVLAAKIVKMLQEAASAKKAGSQRMVYRDGKPVPWEGHKGVADRDDPGPSV